MTKGLEIDFETRSDVDLKKHGVYRYMASPHTKALIASYRIDGGPLKRWRYGEPCPADIVAHVEAGGQISAHNAGFERLLWQMVLTPRKGWPVVKTEQFRCTAATAAAMSLPRSLDKLGAALQLKRQKDKVGTRLIRKFSIPRKPREDEDPNGGPYWNEPENHPADFALFIEYCDVDMLTEAEADARLIPLSNYEQAVYTLNEKINDRGIRLDVKSARAAVEMAERAKKKLDAEMREITGKAVKACTNVADLKAWCGTRGVTIEAAGKEDLEELLEEIDDLPDDVRKALEVRLEAAKTSVSKITAMLDAVSEDERMRGLYLHHGAGQTGRFSSRRVQVHNPPKPRKEFEEFEPGRDGKLGPPDLRVLFDVIRSADPDAVEWIYGPKLGRTMHLLSDAVRGFMWAAPGHEYINADYASIEGRMAAWFAGEDWKLDAFVANDEGRGPGMYELTAAGIYGIAVEDVKKAIHRPTGKVAELSCQYQTGVGGIRKFARQNKIKLAKLYPTLWDVADGEQREYVEKRFADRVAAHDEHAKVLGREGWIAGELIKTGWRAKHPCIVDAWSLLEDAATQAVLNPGSTHSALGVSYRVAHGFLWCKLPSGRCLAYGAPRFQDVEAPWADKTLPEAKREKKKSVTVMGVDSQTEKWVRFAIYGGSLFNNVVQGSARDILVNGMFLAEEAGYPIVLHTHDELMAELPRGVGNYREFEQIICQLPDWADGLPLVASGWAGKRYRK